MDDSTEQASTIPLSSGDSTSIGNSATMSSTLEELHHSERNDITRDIQSWGIVYNSRRRTAAPVYMRGACTGWIDDDDSGNYDPKSEREQQKAKQNFNLGIVKPNGNDRNHSLSLSKELSSATGSSSPQTEDELSDGSDLETSHSKPNSRKKKPSLIQKPTSKNNKNKSKKKKTVKTKQHSSRVPFSGIGPHPEWESLKGKIPPTSRTTGKTKQSSNKSRKSQNTTSSRVKRIKTAFCHPITFNHIPDSSNKHPCSWCDSPFFGLSGHGVVEVEVLAPSAGSGSGYEEISGGHVQNGRPNSKMCVLCTFSRLRIIMCGGHQIGPIPGMDPRRYDHRLLQESIEALKRSAGKNSDGGVEAYGDSGDEDKGQFAMRTKWCSVCPAPAFYQCCTKQQFNEFGEPTATTSNSNSKNDSDKNLESTKGCGLLLCEVCLDLTFKVAEVPKSATMNEVVIESTVLSRVIRCANEKFMRLSYPEGVRADAEFLTSEGELLVRMQNGAGN
ncbi:hypothetical protein F5884DRAFT_281954 [Xylogone sp. PMI_703]|nr:hypothetical protein F5884DRAFT_281954 [Xylogone sp. PMI_703]